MKTKEELIERIERETMRMKRHEMEIENNRISIAKAKRLLLEQYGETYN